MTINLKDYDHKYTDITPPQKGYPSIPVQTPDRAAARIDDKMGL
ncbi:MAG: hypothetical protein ACXVAY_19760 [Mucilaginibacter sp.]